MTIHLDTDLGEEYLAESREHLTAMEQNLLALELGGTEVDEELVNRFFRSVHSVKGGSGFFGLETVRELAHRMEHVAALLRSRQLLPTPHRIGVLLAATDRLQDLLANPAASNQADISATIAALSGLCAPEAGTAGESGRVAAAVRGPHGGPLRALLVEDEFSSRLLLQTFLSRYGECHVAVNGREAVEAFRAAFERGQPYHLICMDIMMPEMDGREAVRQVRAMEEAAGILSTDGSKIIMTTAVDDIKEVIRCFRELCDSYLLKPIDLAQLLSLMQSHQLVP
jgi:two-component system chemotaxis response regulator CheY